MLAVVSIVMTIAALSALLAFTELLDRRQAMRLVRRAADARVPADVAEQLVAEECKRLLERSGHEVSIVRRPSR